MGRYAARRLAVVLCGLAAITASRANCFPPKQFTQLGATQYQYVLFPPGTPATAASIVGRFWQPGQYAGTSEGACGESAWLIPCLGDCPAVTTSPAFYINGYAGSSSCPSGCPSGEMILLLQERGAQGGIFAVARVTETVGFAAFDFSRLQRDVSLAPIPRPRVTSTERVGTNYRLHVQFDDPAPGFFGLPGVAATGTITAIHLYTRITTASPPVDRTAWTFRQRIPYLGGATSTTIDIPSEQMCIGGGYDFRIVSALELDDGQVVTDYVSEPTRVSSCLPETITGTADVPDGSLLVSRTAQGDLALSWSATCFPAGGAAYSVYEGTLGDWTSHLPRSCAVFGTAATFPEPAGSSYYLAVPYAPNLFFPDLPPGFEGSYGTDGAGTERPPSLQACAVRWVQHCP